MLERKDLESAIGGYARDREGALDPRWEALASGTLGPSDMRALRELDPALYEVFRPPSDVEGVALTERVLDAANVGAPKRARWRAGLAVVALVTACVAFALLLARPPSGGPLPDYEIVMNDEVWRTGDRVVPVEKTRGAPWRIDLRPSTRIEGPVGFLGFLARENDVRPWAPAAEVGPKGTIRISGPVETLFAGVPEGQWDIVLIVARPEVLNARAKSITEAIQWMAAAPSAPLPPALQGGCLVLRTKVRLELPLAPSP